jgi:hypothetical protein
VLVMHQPGATDPRVGHRRRSLGATAVENLKGARRTLRWATTFFLVTPARIGVTMPSTGLSDYEKKHTAATITVLHKRDVCEALKVSQWTLDRWIRQGSFAPPTFLTPTSNVGTWTLRYVEAFLEKRRRARRVKPKPRGLFKFKRSDRRARAQGGGDA